MASARAVLKLPARLELLKEVAPRVTRAAVLRELGIAPGLAQFGAIQALAPSLGVELRPVGVAMLARSSAALRRSRRVPTAASS